MADTSPVQTTTPEWPSEAWFDALSATVAEQSRHWTCSLSEPLTLAMHVKRRSAGGDAAPVEWFLTITAETLHVTFGQAPHPSVTILTDESVVEDLIDGRINAQQAVDANRLKVRGDLNRLAALGSALSSLTALMFAPQSREQSQPQPPSQLHAFNDTGTS